MINTYPDPVRSVILGMPTWDDEVWDALQEKNFEKAGAAFEETLRNLTPEEWSSVIWSGLVRGWPILRGTLTETEWDEQFLPEAALAILSVLSPGGLSDLYYSLEPDEVPMFHRLFLEVMVGDSPAEKAEWLKKGRPDLYPFFAANAAGLHFEPSGRNLLSAEGVRRYAVLTPGLLETILSAQTAEIVIRVAEQQKAPAPKIPAMADSLGSVILGLTPLKNFSTELQKSGLEAALATAVAKSLEERVLASVKSEVEKMSAVGPTPLPKLAPVLPSSATGLPFGFGGGAAKAPAAMPSGAPLAKPAPMPPAVASPAPAAKSSPTPAGPVPVVIRTSPVVQPVATQGAKLGSGPGFNLKDLAASSASPTPARLEIGVPVAAPKPTVGRAESAPAKVVHYSQWSPASGPAPAAAPTKPAAPAAAPVPFADLGRRPGAPASASETIRPVSSPSAASQPLPGSPLSAKQAAPVAISSASAPPASVPVPNGPALPSVSPAIKATVPPAGSGVPPAVPVTAKPVIPAPAAPAAKAPAPPVPPPTASAVPKPPAPPASSTASQPSSVPSAPVAPPAEKVNFLSRFGGSAMHSHSVPLPGPQAGASSAPKPPPSSGPVPKPEPKSGTIDLGSF